MRLVIASVLGCAALAASAVLPAGAAGTTIYLTIKSATQGGFAGWSSSGSGAVQTQPSPHEYKLENFSQNGPGFTATTPLDGSSSALPNMAGQNFPSVIVRLDGHTLNDAFEFTNCSLKSDKVTANSSSATIKLSFVCQRMQVYVVPQPTPTPRPVQMPADMRPNLLPAPTPTPTSK